MTDTEQKLKKIHTEAANQGAEILGPTFIEVKSQTLTDYPKEDTQGCQNWQQDDLDGLLVGIGPPKGLGRHSPASSWALGQQGGGKTWPRNHLYSQQGLRWPRAQGK